LSRLLQIVVITATVILGLARAAAALSTAEMLAAGTLGSDKAPVTIVEYASLTCPHCAKFANSTFEVLKTKYIDTGKVHFIYRDFPFDQVGLRAAMMARCAGPDQFFGFLAVLFKSQESWAGAKDPLDELAKIGRLGGLGKEQFDACMNDKALMDGILNGRLEAEQKLEVKATPTFIINGVKHEGYMPIEEFDKILEPLLNKG
jgi:protein-disulfide isomerase